MLDSIVDNYVLIDSELEDDLDRIERNIFGGTKGDYASEIYELKREVLEFKRASVPLAEPVRRLAKDRSVPMPELKASVNVGGSEFYYGYFVVMALMAAGVTFLYRLFKRSGWL